MFRRPLFSSLLRVSRLLFCGYSGLIAVCPPQLSPSACPTICRFIPAHCPALSTLFSAGWRKNCPDAAIHASRRGSFALFCVIISNGRQHAYQGGASFDTGSQEPIEGLPTIKMDHPGGEVPRSAWSKEPIPTIHNEGVPHPSDRVIAFGDLDVSYWLGMRREKNQWLEE